jgi:hypothetical protein
MEPLKRYNEDWASVRLGEHRLPAATNFPPRMFAVTVLQPLSASRHAGGAWRLL